jgi:hypothetical protein
VTAIFAAKSGYARIRHGAKVRALGPRYPNLQVPALATNGIYFRLRRVFLAGLRTSLSTK